MQKTLYEKITGVALAAFITLELLLLPLIQLTPADVSTVSSYFAIAAVTVFAALCYRTEKDKRYIILGIALTLVADTFLLLCDDAELYGVLSFIMVQAAYAVYLAKREMRSSVRRVSIFLRVALSLILVGVAFAVLGKNTDPLSVASVVYYGNLVINTALAFLLGRSERVFSVGLLLFCMCDLSIGLETLFDVYLNSDALDFFYGKYLNLPWLFYQPSQILIAISVYLEASKSSGEA